MDIKKVIYRSLNLFVPIARSLNIQTGLMKWLRQNSEHMMTHQGRPFYFDENDDGYLIKGGYEEGEIKYLSKTIQPDWIAVDVGANVGYFTVFFGTKCSKVYAIEPYYKNLELLRRNTSNLPVTIIPGVASDITGQVELHVPERKTDCSIKPSKERIDTEKVESYRLDDLIKEKIDIIKIDVQGAETEVLIGSKRLIEQYKPMLIIEYENPPASLLETLKDFNYRFYSINSKGITKAEDYLYFTGNSQNIVAIHYLDERNS